MDKFSWQKIGPQPKHVSYLYKRWGHLFDCEAEEVAKVLENAGYIKLINKEMYVESEFTTMSREQFYTNIDEILVAYCKEKIHGKL